MMGHNGGNQNRLFHSFNLEDHVPANHLLRGVNHFLDLADLRVFNDRNSHCAESLYCDSATWTPAVAQCFSARGTQPRAANQFTTENIAPATTLDRLQCAALAILIRHGALS